MCRPALAVGPGCAEQGSRCEPAQPAGPAAACRSRAPCRPPRPLQPGYAAKACSPISFRRKPGGSQTPHFCSAQHVRGHRKNAVRCARPCAEAAAGSYCGCTAPFSVVMSQHALTYRPGWLVAITHMALGCGSAARSPPGRRDGLETLSGDSMCSSVHGWSTPSRPMITELGRHHRGRGRGGP